MNSTLDLFVCLSNPARSALIANAASQYPASAPDFVVRDTVTLRVRFYEKDASTQLISQVDIGAVATLAFGAKRKGFLLTATVFLFFSAAFTRNADDADDIYFETELDLNTVAFSSAFTDDSLILLTCELEVSEGGERRTVAQFDANGVFDVIRGSESPPYSLPSYSSVSFFPTITGHTGGGPTNLDGIPTVDVNLGVAIQVVVGGVLQTWQLQVGTEGDVEDVASGIIKPDDFGADDNAKIWVRVA